MIRWGILGAGIIAHRLADAVRRHPKCELSAVASRTPGKAEAFAREERIEAADSYESLVGDAAIDVVYVATTHNFHADNVRLALDAGKHVLVEKPFTVNAREARDLVDRARTRGCFLMEAMWTRYLPSIRALRQQLSDGAIGTLHHLETAFGGFVPDHYRHRLETPELAGGVTLDMGVYPISFACFMTGERPTDVQSMARMSETGVDELVMAQFSFPSGATASITTSYDLRLKSESRLYGSHGFIELHEFPAGERFTVHRHDGGNEILSSETVTTANGENGFIHQVDEVVQCLEAGRLESPTLPLDESVEIMAIMDGMRAEWGLVYPFEDH